MFFSLLVDPRISFVRLIVLFVVACPNCRVYAQTTYDSGDPSADEQYVLEIINRARANPSGEGARLGLDISEGLLAGTNDVSAKPPLAMNKILLGSARAHSLDMHTRKFFAHINLDGKDPFSRITHSGYAYTAAGENIAASAISSAATLEDLLMVDAGLPGRGHRKNLLNTNPSILYREIGIGFYSGTTPVTGGAVNGFKNFLTQDFGTSSTGPFVLGVVYFDANRNGFYDIGEGLSGVTITPDSGNFSAVTGSAGGYAFPVASSGNLTIIATGGSLPSTMQKQISLNGVNTKVDFLSADAPIPPSIEVKSAKGTFDFKRKGIDTLKLTALISNVKLPASLAKLRVTVSFGEISRSLILDKRGKGVRKDTSITLKRGKPGAPDTLILTIEGSDFTGRTPLKSSGMDGSIGVKNAARSLTGSIDVGNGPIPYSVNASYSASAKKTGGFHKVK